MLFFPHPPPLDNLFCCFLWKLLFPLSLGQAKNFLTLWISHLGFWISFVDTQHQFNARESDWGFTSFMPLQELYDPMRGFLVNDTLVLEADVNVRKVVDYWAYDSKKETGFVGLKNQGATCYMNSLLQTLYHLAYFRKVLSLSCLLAPISFWNPCSYMCTLDVVVQVGRGDGLMGFFESKGMSFAARTNRILHSSIWCWISSLRS